MDAPQSLELEVTGQETLSLGKCDYKVLRIKQTTRENDKLVDQQSVLYSPDLEAILARIYDEGTASELIVHYDSISTLTVD